MAAQYNNPKLTTPSLMRTHEVQAGDFSQDVDAVLHSISYTLGVGHEAKRVQGMPDLWVSLEEYRSPGRADYIIERDFGPTLSNLGLKAKDATLVVELNRTDRSRKILSTLDHNTNFITTLKSLANDSNAARIILHIAFPQGTLRAVAAKNNAAACLTAHGGIQVRYIYVEEETEITQTRKPFELPAMEIRNITTRATRLLASKLTGQSRNATLPNGTHIEAIAAEGDQAVIRMQVVDGNFITALVPRGDLTWTGGTLQEQSSDSATKPEADDREHAPVVLTSDLTAPDINASMSETRGASQTGEKRKDLSQPSSKLVGDIKDGHSSLTVGGDDADAATEDSSPCLAKKRKVKSAIIGTATDIHSKAHEADPFDELACRRCNQPRGQLQLINCAGLACPGGTIFHLVCVGLLTTPGPGRKFYCVDCRDQANVKSKPKPYLEKKTIEGRGPVMLG